MPTRQTHTYAVLDISPEAFSEIERKLRDADYGHCFSKDDGRTVIDMSGVAVAPGAPRGLMPPDHWVMQESLTEEIVCANPLDWTVSMSMLRARVRIAARQAIRGATANGTILDFDPDTMVQNFELFLCGPNGRVESAQ